MAIRCTGMHAFGNVLTLAYADDEEPLFTCQQEFEVDDYTRGADGGKTPFASIRSAQWRAVCKDIVTLKRATKADQESAFACIMAFASDAAKGIFMDEARKEIVREVKAHYKSSRKSAAELDAISAEAFDRFRARIARLEARTLDQFAGMIYPRFTLDQFAEAVSA